MFILEFNYILKKNIYYIVQILTQIRWLSKLK